jgi:hypothetical protein
VLSITTAPASTANFANSADTLPPALKISISTSFSSKHVCVNSNTVYSLFLNSILLPALL